MDRAGQASPTPKTPSIVTSVSVVKVCSQTLVHFSVDPQGLLLGQLIDALNCVASMFLVLWPELRYGEDEQCHR